MPDRHEATPASPGEELLDYEELALVLRTPRSYAERLVAQRRIAYLKVGRYVRIRRRDVEEFLASARVPAAKDVE